MSTQSTDIVFVPQVANDHLAATFERKMGLMSLAVSDDTLKAAPGETVTFPYFKEIGEAQEVAEDEALEVDKLVDDKFSVTIKEVGKAVGWTDKALRVSGAGRSPQEVKSRNRTEALSQMGTRFAEHVDKDLITNVLSSAANYKTGFTAAAAADVFNVGNLLDMKIGAFGDKQEQAIAVAIHSLHFATLMKDAGTGFLKADATHPFYGAPGYQGLLLGQAVFVLDTMPRVADVGGKKAYAAYSFKANPFGIYWGKDFQPEEDRDILARENLLAGTMWYGLLGLHAKTADHDLRIARGTFTTAVNA